MHICELCGQGDFASADDLRSHVSSVHNSDFGSGASCPFCDLTGITSKEMSIHVQAVHDDSIPSSPLSKKPRRINGVDVTPPATASSPPQPLSSCPLCPACFSESAKLERHVNVEHRDILSPDRPSRQQQAAPGAAQQRTELRCPVCALSDFPNAESLARHADGHFSNGGGSNEEGDRLLARELQREERAAREADERREFERLRAEYGMNGRGSYDRQMGEGMERAVRRGHMSSVEYHEKRVESLQSRSSGADSGDTRTRGALDRIRPSVAPIGFLASSPVDHFSAGYGDRGWGCGYRNLQMLLSCLGAHEPYASVLRRAGAALTGGAGVPSIPRLQGMIEAAWAAGFDAPGAEQLGGRLTGTRKWIGSTEVVTFLRYCGVKAHVMDFHRPTGPKDTHPALFDWVREYFETRSLTSSLAPPLFFQHKGHSRTLVGIETACMRNGCHQPLAGGRQPLADGRLLIFDPSCSKDYMSKGADALLLALRKKPSSIKSPQYQIVFVDGVYQDHDVESRKTINPQRVPP